jgi:hypothetical protein
MYSPGMLEVLMPLGNGMLLGIRLWKLPVILSAYRKKKGQL